jgi:REP element-mobilizing transposase RayT
MSEYGYKITDQNAIHFITFSVIQWVDALSRPQYKDIIVESLIYCQKEKGLNIHAWVIMSNHVHLICSAKEPFLLSDILRDFKKYTSAQLLKTIEDNTQESRKSWMLWIFKKAGNHNKRNEHYQFWQHDNHPIECSTSDILETRMKYLHENPVKAGIVYHEEEYVYSSATDYYTNENGLISIDFV